MDDWLDAEQLASQAMELLERGRWSEAEAQLRRALAVDPGQIEWQYHLGVVLEAQGRDREARTAFDAAVDPAGDACDALLASASASARLGDWQAARDSVEQVLQRQPAAEEAHARMIEVHRMLGDHDEAEAAFYLAEMTLDGPSADCLCEVGMSLADREQWRRAAWCLRRSIALDPMLPMARRRLAEVLARTGQVQRAVELYEKELREDPAQIELLIGYAGLLEQLGRLDDAAMRLQRALDVDPMSIEANHQLGRLALRMGCPDRAAVAFQLVRRLERTHPTVDRDLAQALLQAGQVGDARRLLGGIVQQVREAQDDGMIESPAMQLSLVALLLAASMHDDAAERVETLLGHGYTPDVDTWRLVALVRFSAGDLDGGRTASRRVLRDDANCLRSIGNLAWAALQQGRLAEAAAWVRRGRRVDRDDERLRSLRARVWIARLRAIVRR